MLAVTTYWAQMPKKTDAVCVEGMAAPARPQKDSLTSLYPEEVKHIWFQKVFFSLFKLLKLITLRKVKKKKINFKKIGDWCDCYCMQTHNMGVTVCFYTAKCSRILVRLKDHANCALSARLITQMLSTPIKCNRCDEKVVCKIKFNRIYTHKVND